MQKITRTKIEAAHYLIYIICKDYVVFIKVYLLLNLFDVNYYYH